MGAGYDHEDEDGHDHEDDHDALRSLDF